MSDKPKDDEGKDEAQKPEHAKDDESKGQYGSLGGIGPGGGDDFEDVKRPARPDDDRLPSRKD